MVERKIPTEIRAYKGKLAAGLTVRQLAAIGGAILTGVPIGIIGSKFISMDILLWFLIVIAVIFAAWGFGTWKGMRFEEFVVVLFNFYFLPRKRVYEDTQMNLFIKISEQIIEEDIRQQRIDCGDYDSGDEYEYEEYEEAR